MKRPAVILDRDGTLIRDTGYLHRPEDLVWLPGVLPALARWKAEGRLLVVVTNQSGIGRGLYSEADYGLVTLRLRADAAAAGAELDGIWHCPHAPENPCGCRKPAPGLVLEAIRTLDIDAERSVAIGDRPRDLEAAARAGITRGIAVATDEGLTRVTLTEV